MLSVTKITRKLSQVKNYYNYLAIMLGISVPKTVC